MGIKRELKCEERIKRSFHVLNRKTKMEDNILGKEEKYTPPIYNEINSGMTLFGHGFPLNVPSDKSLVLKNLLPPENTNIKSEHPPVKYGDDFYDRPMTSYNDHFPSTVPTMPLFANLDGRGNEHEDMSDVPTPSQKTQKKEEKREKFRRWRHKEYQCDDCDRMFTLKHNLQNHYVLYHMGVRTIYKPCPSCKCEICGKIYSAPSVLAEHLQAAHKMQGKKEECSICFEKFLTITALNRHFKKEHGRELKKCTFPECKNLEFRFIKDLNEHIKNSHKSNHKSSLTCSICDRTFRKATAKVKHEQNHMASRIERQKQAIETCVKTEEYNERQLKYEIMDEAENDYERDEKADLKEDIKQEDNISQMPKHLRKFHQELEAIPIKRKVAKRICKDEILAKIK